MKKKKKWYIEFSIKFLKYNQHCFILCHNNKNIYISFSILLTKMAVTAEQIQSWSYTKNIFILVVFFSELLNHL